MIDFDRRPSCSNVTSKLNSTEENCFGLRYFVNYFTEQRNKIQNMSQNNELCLRFTLTYQIPFFAYFFFKFKNQCI